MSDHVEWASATISFPASWALVMPCGCIDGLMQGSVRLSTADATWKKFTPLKRDRDREARQGWTVRPATIQDLADYRTSTGPHEEAHHD